MELLVWALGYVNPKALDTAPSVVGPGHNGGCSTEATVPGWLKRSKKFEQAMAAARRLKDPKLNFPCGIVVRDSVCEHCRQVEPWIQYQWRMPPQPFYRVLYNHRGREVIEEVQPNTVQPLRPEIPSTLSQVLWMAYGSHGKGTKLVTTETHLGWQFGSDVSRYRWAAISSHSVRGSAMASLGRWLLGCAVTIYENLNDSDKIYREIAHNLGKCGYFIS